MANIALPAPAAGATSNWVPFGNGTTNFTGTFNGQGYTVSNLILDDSTNHNVGFVGINAGTVENLVLQGSVTLTSNTIGQTGGILAGENGNTLASVRTKGTVQANSTGPSGNVGGLVGTSVEGTIQNAMSTATVSALGNTGGGLLGLSVGDTLTNVAATGSVSGTTDQSSPLGGLIGGILGSDTITNAYASGAVTPTGVSIGGFIGSATAPTISDSYFDASSTGQTSATGSASGGTLPGVSSETTTALQQASTYTGWNFTTVWSLIAGVNNGLPVIDMPIPQSAPNAPTLTTVTPGAQQLTVQWSVPTQDGHSPITGYIITATPTTGPAPSPTTVSGTATTATLTGLTNGVAYTVTIQAVNAIGSSIASNSLTGTPLSATDPSAPLSLQGTTGNGQVTLQWLPPTNTGNSVLTGSVIEATYGSGANAGTVTQNVPANVYSAVVPNLTNGTPYTFTVVARNAIGASPASNAVILTPASVPDAPVNLTGIVGNGQVTLQWTLPTNLGGSALTTTAVYGSSAQGGNFVKTLSPTITSTTLTGLTNGTAYTFTVTATNGVGTSAGSNPVTLTPKAPSVPITPPPSNFTPPSNPTPPPTTTPSSPPKVQITTTQVSVPVGLTALATFNFANRNAATIHFPVPVTQPLTITLKRWPGVPIGLPNYRDLFGIIEVTVHVAQHPTTAVLPIPTDDTLIDIADHSLPVGTLIMEWNDTAHGWIHIATITHPHTTQVAVPIPTQTPVLYAFARPKS